MKPRIISLPKILDPRGNLTFLQHTDQVPFEIKRVFWIYGVPGGETRGGHAYKSQCELIIALSGSFDIVVFTFSVSDTMRHKQSAPTKLRNKLTVESTSDLMRCSRDGDPIKKFNWEHHLDEFLVSKNRRIQ